MRSLIFPLILLLGCSASQLERHVAAASVTRVALNVAKEAIEVVCAPARVMESDNPAQMRDRCLKAIEGHDSTRVLWEVWAVAIIDAHEDEEALVRIWSLVGPLLESYGELSEFLALFDVTLPSLSFGAEE